MLFVALALPFVAWIQEELLKRYPVAESMCIVKQWAPWLVATLIAVAKFAAIRRWREARDRRRMQKKAHGDLKCLVEHTQDLVENEGSTCSSEETISEDALPAVEHPIQITEVRKINGFFDGLRELKEWWVNPIGEQKEEATNNLSTADEEKALLNEHYEQNE